MASVQMLPPSFQQLIHVLGGGLIGRPGGDLSEDPFKLTINNLRRELMKKIHLGFTCVSTLDWELSPRVMIMSSEHKE